MKRFLINATKILLILLIVIMATAVALTIMVRSEYQDKVYSSIQELPDDSVMVVLGASVKRDATPSDALEDRLDMAVRAWRAGKVDKIILSGDDGRWAQEETQAMLGYMYSQGVPDHLLIIDGNNARTFDSCYRLRNELHEDNVVLITQSFHLPRALYLCNELGIDAWGLDSDLRWYQDIVWFTARDWLASLLAFWDIYDRRLPTYLEN